MTAEPPTSLDEHDAESTRQPAHHSNGERLTPGLARNLAELAREMQSKSDAATLLDCIVASAVEEIDAAVWACITEIARQRVRIRAASHPVVERVDRLQIQAGDGPCLTSLREHATVRSDDLSVDRRWPAFGPAAVNEGVRSMLSVQLFVHDDNLGALNLYSPMPDAFTMEDENVAVLLAAHAAVALKGASTESNLRTAVASRDTIGQAKGVLIERYKITSHEAFSLLVLASQKSNRKLRDIAADLVETGDFQLD